MKEKYIYGGTPAKELTGKIKPLFSPLTIEKSFKLCPCLIYRMICNSLKIILKLDFPVIYHTSTSLTEHITKETLMVKSNLCYHSNQN